MKKKKLLIVLGTRPEVIKLAALYFKLQHNDKFKVYLCNTEQQKELSNQTLSFFSIKADFNLDVMLPNQNLSSTQALIQAGLTDILAKESFDAVIVQGDTLSAFCGALVGFYSHVPVFHVEAGLRSYNLDEPFPEEALRQMISRLASLNFAPTPRAQQYLLDENIVSSKISITGNTVIDAFSYISKKSLDEADSFINHQSIDLNKDLVLVTVHRRENHGERLTLILNAIEKLCNSYPNVQFVLPVHPNPNVKRFVIDRLSKFENVIITAPLDYPVLTTVMKHSKLILTDSGGIQEEAPTFHVPLLVLRYETERPEGVEAGFAKLLGADENLIFSEASQVLNNQSTFNIENKQNPYGNGFAADKIQMEIEKFFVI